MNARPLAAGSLLLVLAAMAVGCSELRATSPGGQVTNAAIAPRSLAFIEGQVSGPPGLIANGSAGLIANGSAGLIANGSAGLARRASLALRRPGEEFLPGQVVYLTTPSGDFFRDDNNRPVSSVTDNVGRYIIERNIPQNTPVIVSVVLPGDRRLVGYTKPGPSGNRVDVSVATTLVTEYLRAQAPGDKSSIASFDLGRVPDLISRTEQLLEAGRMPVPSLRIGDIPEMNRQYALAIGQDLFGLGGAWKEMLDRRIVAGVTFAGTGDPYSTVRDGTPALQAGLSVPKGIVADAEGNVYVAEEGGHLIRHIAPGGKVRILGGVAVADVGRPGFPGPNPRATSSYFNWPRTLTLGPDGNLYVADVFNMRIRAICLKPALTFGRDMYEVGNVYTIVGKPNCREGASQCDNGFERDEAAQAGGEGVPALEARVTGVRGMAFDRHGHLVFSDSWGWPEKGRESEPTASVRHRIRVLAARTGTFYGVAMQAGHVHTIAGKDGITGFAGDDPRPALNAPIGYPQAVALHPDGRVLFCEADNDRIRAISPDGTLTTFAGGGTRPAAGTNPDYGDGGEATSAYLGRPFGLAVDKEGQVYVTMRSANLIRRIDTNGIIRTVAGTETGGVRSDHDARLMAINQPFDLTMLPDGSLLTSEARGHRLLRFFVQWGL
ncbi:MAG: hypothetical protein VKO21_08355 [Candidatus Sericytochromatia bacterium]|nr:hypothetical protein [Candidatus Sericytochromatia bacterium]